MPIPHYLESSAAIRQRQYEIRQKTLQDRRDYYLRTHPVEAKLQEQEQQDAEQAQKLANIQEQNPRTFWDNMFNQKPIEAELNPLYAIDSPTLMGLQRDQLKDVPYFDPQPINNWKQTFLFRQGTVRATQQDRLAMFGMDDWSKGELKNIRYNYNLLRSNGKFDLAQQYLNDVVNDRYKLVATETMPQRQRDNIIRQRQIQSGQKYDNVDVSPNSTKAIMHDLLPNYREFENSKNHLGHRYLDFSDAELSMIGSKWKDILRMYGENDAYSFLYNTVQQRIADNTPLGQRVVNAGYGLITNGVSTVASLAGMLGSVFDFNASNNAAYNPSDNWFQNRLNIGIDNAVTRWAKDLMEYQTWNPNNITDDMRTIGGRFAGAMRGPGQDVFNDPWLLIPETVKQLGYMAGFMTGSVALSATTKATTKALNKTVTNIIKTASKNTLATQKALTKFNNVMASTDHALNLLNAGVVSSVEGVQNAIGTYDDAQHGEYQALATKLGLNPQQNSTFEDILNNLTLHQMADMGASSEDPQQLYDRLYQQNYENLRGYNDMIIDKSREAARKDFWVNAAINGPINMATQQFLFSPAVRDAIHGSRVNRALRQRTEPARQRRLERANSRRTKKGKEPIVMGEDYINPTWAIVKGAIGEGLEEYLQEASTDAAQGSSLHYVDQFLKDYSNADAIEIFSDGLSDADEPNIPTVGAYFRSAGKALFSRQAAESLLLGTIGGMLVPNFNVTAKAKDGSDRNVWLHRGLREDGSEETRWQAIRRAIPLSFTPVANAREAMAYNKQMAEYEKEIKERLKSMVGDNPEKLEDLRSVVKLITLQDRKQDAMLNRDDFVYRNAKLEEAVELSLLFRRRPNSNAAKMYYDAMQRIANMSETSDDAAQLAQIAAEALADNDMYTDDDGNLDTKALFGQIKANAQKLLDIRDRVAKEDKRLNRLYGYNLSVDARKAMIFGSILQDNLAERLDKLTNEVSAVTNQIWKDNLSDRQAFVEDIMKYRSIDNAKNLRAQYEARLLELENELAKEENKDNQKLEDEKKAVEDKLDAVDNYINAPTPFWGIATPGVIASLSPEQRSRFIQDVLNDAANAEDKNKPHYDKQQLEFINIFFEQGNRIDPDFASKARDLGRVQKAYEQTIKDNADIASNPNKLASRIRTNQAIAISRIYEKRVDKLQNETTQEGFDNAMNDIRKDLNASQWTQLQTYILSTEIGKSELYKNWAKRNGYGKMILGQDIYYKLEELRQEYLKDENADKNQVNLTFTNVATVVRALLETVDSIDKLPEAIQNYLKNDKTCTEDMKDVFLRLLRDLPNMISVKENASRRKSETPPAKKGTKEKKKKDDADIEAKQRKGDVAKDDIPEENDDEDNQVDLEMDELLELERKKQEERKKQDTNTQSKEDKKNKKEDFNDENLEPNTDSDILADIVDKLSNVEITDEMSDDEIDSAINDEIGMDEIDSLSNKQLDDIIHTVNLNERIKIFFQNLLDDRTTLKGNPDETIDEAEAVDESSENPGKILPLNGDSEERLLTSQKRTKYVFYGHSDEENTQKGSIGPNSSIVDILESHGALSFVNSGRFADIIRANPNTPIYFLRWKQDTNQMPYLFLAIESEEGDIVMDGRTFQMVGCLGYSDEEGAGEAENRVIKQFLSTMDNDSDFLNGDDFVSTDMYTTKVKQLYTGKYIESEEPHDVTREWLDGRPLVLQFYYGPKNHPIVNLPADVNESDIYRLYVEDELDDRYNGSIWLYFKVADGRWFPSQVTLKMFDRTAYDLDANWDTPFVKELREQAKILFESADIKERLSARHQIYSLLYFLDRDENDRPSTPIIFDDEHVSIMNTGDPASENLESPEALIRYIYENIETRISLHDLYFNENRYQNMPYEDFILQSGILSTTHTVAGNVNGGFTIYEGTETNASKKPVVRTKPTRSTEQRQPSENIKVTIDGITRIYYRTKVGDNFIVTDNEAKKQNQKISSLISAIIDSFNIQNKVVSFQFSGRTYLAELNYPTEDSVEVAWMGTEKQYSERKKEKSMKEAVEGTITGTKSPAQLRAEKLSNAQDQFQDFEFAEDNTADGVTLNATITNSLGKEVNYTFKKCHRIVLRNFPDSIVYVGSFVGGNGKLDTQCLTVIVCDRDGNVVGFESFDNNDGLKTRKPKMYPNDAFNRAAGVSIPNWLEQQGQQVSAEEKAPAPKEAPIPKPNPENKAPRTRSAKTKEDIGTEPNQKSSQQKSSNHVEPSADAITMKPKFKGASEENWENPANDGLYHDDPELVRLWNTYWSLNTLERMDFLMEHPDFLKGPLPLAQAVKHLWEMVNRSIIRRYQEQAEGPDEHGTIKKDDDGYWRWSILFRNALKDGESDEVGEARIVEEDMNKWYEKAGFSFGPYKINGTDWLPFKHECLRRVLSMSMEQGRKWVEQMSNATKSDAKALAENLINCH